MNNKINLDIVHTNDKQSASEHNIRHKNSFHRVQVSQDNSKISNLPSLQINDRQYPQSMLNTLDHQSIS